MNTTWKSGFVGLAGVALLAGAFVGMNLSQPVRGDGEAKGAANGARYTVVQTQAEGLIVTDNRTNTLYFYSPDADSEDKAGLKLRGTIDLNDVGKDKLSARPVKKQ